MVIKRTGSQPSELPMVLWLALVLALTFAAYLPSLRNGFTNWDDPVYVLNNPLLRHPTVGAVLTTPVNGSWYPLTIGSYALNYRMSGLDPAPYHWLNLLLHLANTALVFVFVHGLAPRRLWPAVITGLFFGIHPMHVESVAWITERKDVLYAFFYLLGLQAYLRYLKSSRLGWLCVALATFVLSAASKPAAVVFPLTLVAIDFYRRRPFDARGVLEKIPFFAVSAVILMLTFRAQASAGAIHLEESGPVFPRILVACFGIMMYVGKLFVPIALSAVYPYPQNPAISLGPEFYLAFVLVLVGVPTTIYLCRGNRPALFGVAFFFINLFLVLQFVSVGHVVMADRFTYIPYVGLFFALAWGLDEQPAPGCGLTMKSILAGVLLLLIPVSLVQTWTRCKVWHDSGSLWSDVIRQYPGRSFDAYNNRGLFYQERGRYEEAIADLKEALALDPRSPRAWIGMGVCMARVDKPDSALACFDRALQLKPESVEALSGRGAMRLQRGDLSGAISDCSEVIKLNPEVRGAYVNRGIAYNRAGDLERSVADYRRAIELEPENLNAYQLWGAIGDALERSKRPQEAVAAYDQAIRLAPPADSLRGAFYLSRSRAWLALGERGRAARDAAEAERLGVLEETR